MGKTYDRGSIPANIAESLRCQFRPSLICRLSNTNAQVSAEQHAQCTIAVRHTEGEQRERRRPQDFGEYNGDTFNPTD